MMGVEWQGRIYKENSEYEHTVGDEEGEGVEQGSATEVMSGVKLERRRNRVPGGALTPAGPDMPLYEHAKLRSAGLRTIYTH